MQDAFEILGLAPSFFPDPAQVKKIFYQLSRRFHPDFLTQASPEEQASALEQSAAINQAYKTLQDPDATMALVLTREGLLTPDEKFQLPPDFLMEMMDINEEVMALPDLEAEEAAQNRQKLASTLAQLQADLYAEIQPLLQSYGQEGFTPQQLLPVKTYCFKKKYLNRLLENLG